MQQIRPHMRTCKPFGARSAPCVRHSSAPAAPCSIVQLVHLLGQARPCSHSTRSNLGVLCSSKREASSTGPTTLSSVHGKAPAAAPSSSSSSSSKARSSQQQPAASSEQATASLMSLASLASLSSLSSLDGSSVDGLRGLSPAELRRSKRSVEWLRFKTLGARTRAWLDKRLPRRLQGLIALNLMVLLLGSNWVVVKWSGDTYDPFLFAALRFSLAAAVFAPFLRRGFKDKQVLKAGLEIGCWSALGYLTQSLALEMTDASRASLLSTFTVLAVPVLAGLSGQQIKPLVWVGACAAIFGTGLLEAGGATAPNWGDVVSVLSAIFFAGQLFRTEHHSRHLSPDPAKSALPLMAVSMLVVAGVSATATTALHWQDLTAFLTQVGALLTAVGQGALGHGKGDPKALGELLYTAFCTTDLALFIEVLALQDVTSTEAAMVYSMEPISGAAFACFFLHERFTAVGWLGAGIILLASLATQLTGAGEPDEPQQLKESEEAQEQQSGAESSAIDANAGNSIKEQ